jgi:GTPase
MFTKRLRFLLLQVIDTHFHRDDAFSDMGETEQLVKTFGGMVAEKMIQHRVRPHPNSYMGPGKLKELKEVVRELGVEVVVLNDILKSSQLFRIEKALWEENPQIAVWDRVDLILNIFEKHARTTEAKLQIELAKLTHMGPRIYGLGKTLLSRQGGGIGTRGKGETNIEVERRVIKERKRRIKKQLKQITLQKRGRLTYRQERGFGPVALVGYTSAGKTTLFNGLTGKQKEVHQKLFTTLDTVVGKLKTPDKRLPILVSDTIGFVNDLPPTLIEAFRSTLMESMEAKLILHVIDSSDPQVEDKILVVERILEELELTQPVVRVFNKIDLVKGERTFSDGELGVSAKTGEGLEELKQLLFERLIGR